MKSISVLFRVILESVKDRPDRQAILSDLFRVLTDRHIIDESSIHAMQDRWDQMEKDIHKLTSASVPLEQAMDKLRNNYPEFLGAEKNRKLIMYLN